MNTIKRDLPVCNLNMDQHSPTAVPHSRQRRPAHVQLAPARPYCAAQMSVLALAILWFLCLTLSSYAAPPANSTASATSVSSATSTDSQTTVTSSSAQACTTSPTTEPKTSSEAEPTTSDQPGGSAHQTVTPTTASPVESPAAEDSPNSQELPDLTEASCDTLGQTFNILLNTAIDPPSPAKVWQFCLEGAEEFLQERGLATNWLKNYKGVASDKNLDKLEALTKITSLYRESVQKFPELARDPHFTTALAQAITDSAEDTYTVFLSLEDYSELDNTLTGDYSGSIGATLLPHQDKEGNSHFIVAQTAPGSPAAKAGLRPGDELMAIDDYSLQHATPRECVSRLRGANSSQVKVAYRTHLMRLMKKEQPLRQVTLTRTIVHYPSAYAKVLETTPKIGLLHIDSFSESTNREAEKALRLLENSQCAGYILDLRQNPGGYTNAARDVCSKFLPEHSLAAKLIDKDGQVEKTIETYRNYHDPKPMVVLIDGQTASAAEITAGALQAHKRAVLVGQPSFGKNSSQKIFNLDFPPGQTSSCKVTYSHYRTPDNKDLGTSGLIPDYLVEMPASKRHSERTDLQLQKAIEILLKELTEK